MENVECTNCKWTGVVDELGTLDECPNCFRDDYIKIIK